MITNERINRFSQTARPYLTDGGLETTLIFHDGVDLPEFAAFTELETAAGRARLDKYFDSYLMAAQETDTGFVLDTPTWRANTPWGEKMGLNDDAVEKVNKRAVAYAFSVRRKWESPSLPIILNGVIGPAGDGYTINQAFTPEQARAIHAPQIMTLASAGVDMVTAATMTHASEAIGVVQAAQAAGVPVAISFTVETDGNLPSGQSIGDAIAEVDNTTDNAPTHFMINCAHPDHFKDALTKGAGWISRIGGVRANASRMSHAELDDMEVLDDGNPDELADDYLLLQKLLPHLKVLGGCCGTDHRHISAIGHACVHAVAA